MELEALEQLLSGQAADKAAVSGLDERLATAKALRDNKPSQQRETGYTSILGALTSAMQGNQGREQVARYRPMQEAATRRVNEADAAKQNYGLRLAAEKVKRDQDNIDNTFGAGRTDAANAQSNTEKAAAGLAQYRENMQANSDRTFGANREDQEAKLAEQVRAEKIAAEAGTPAYLQNATTGEEARGTVMPDGQVMMDGKPVGSEWTILKTDSKGRTGGKKGSGEDNPFAKVANADTVIRLLTNPLLGSGTGLSAERFLAPFGVTPIGDDPERGPKLQSMSRDIADIGIDTVKENLEGLGVNPTDKDLKIAFRSVPDKGTQPISWIDWVENSYRPLYEKSYNDAIKAGLKTEEERDAYLAAIDQSIAQGREMWKGDVEEPNQSKTSAVDASTIDLSSLNPEEQAEYDNFSPADKARFLKLRKEGKI